MKKNKKIVLVISVLLLLIIIISTIFIFTKPDKNAKEKQSIINKIDEMDNYDYYLEENATDYYKSLYNRLKEILKEDEIKEEEYAKIVAQLFTTDVFTLNNKISSNNIGGLQFIYTDFKEDFINIAKTSIYSNIKNNIYGDRKQELPTVKNTKIISIENSIFNYKDNKYDSYEIELKIEYEKDLGYPNKYNLTLIPNDKYLQIAAAK